MLSSSVIKVWVMLYICRYICMGNIAFTCVSIWSVSTTKATVITLMLSPWQYYCRRVYSSSSKVAWNVWPMDISACRSFYQYSLHEITGILRVTFHGHFLTKLLHILTQISLKFINKTPVDKNSALVQFVISTHTLQAISWTGDDPVY